MPRAGCSAWATRCTGIRRRTASAPTPRSRTPSTSPGSWRWCLKGQAGPGLLDSYDAERAPIAKQIVTRANKSIDRIRTDLPGAGPARHQGHPTRCRRTWMRACENTPEAEAQRASIRDAIAFKIYEFDAHGVEMNQRYRSNAIVTDGIPEPEFTKDAELHYQPTTWPGARLPHVWLFDHERQGVDARPGRPRAVRAVHRHRRRGLDRRGEDGRRRARHRDRRPHHRPAQGLAGSPGRLGECQRGARQRHRSGPARPSCRAGAARPSPPIRPANCAGCSQSILDR